MFVSMISTTTLRLPIVTTIMIIVLMSTTMIMTEAFSFKSIPSRIQMTDCVQNGNAFRSTDWKYTTKTILFRNNNNNDSNIKEPPLFEPFMTGIRRDFNRRAPYYKSDITDGFNTQLIASVLFLFFACLAPAIGFGGILQTVTGGAIGTIEMVLSTSLCGILYALLSAQPLQLIGPMGPNLAFTLGLFRLSQRLALPFLPLYAYTGIWTSLLLALFACTSTSNITNYLTAFTDEIFSVLISTIFLVGAVQEVIGAFIPITASSTKALLTLLCASITFGSSIVLKGLNRSTYFTKRIRNNLSNFAPAIGVLFGSLLARAVSLRFGTASGANLASLSLPAGGVGFVSTTIGRKWLIPWKDIVAFPMWAKWASFFPATLASLLLFLDQNITARLVNNPRYKQKKGRDLGNVTDGMHGDMLILSFLTAVTSILGLPWMSGATIRSAAHVQSLSVIDDDGITIRGTIENRVSGVAIHVLIGISVLLARPRALLAQVPLPVLSGVFMYLGLTSLQGLELWDRVKELFEDTSVAPTKRWTGIVPKKVTTLFTIVQLSCIYAMMKVKESSSFGVVFPLIIAMMPVLRYGIVKFGLIDKESFDILDRTN